MTKRRREEEDEEKKEEEEELEGSERENLVSRNRERGNKKVLKKSRAKM